MARVQPFEANPLGTITADSDAAIAGSAGLRYCGYAVRENAGTPAEAEFLIKHGTTAAGGTLLTPVTLAENGSDSLIFDGIAIPNGISIDWISGSVDLVIFTRDTHAA